MVMIQDSSSVHSSPKEKRSTRTPRFVFGKLHVTSAMTIIVSFGAFVILLLLAILFFKFKKAMFVLAIPTAITAITAFAIYSKKHRLVWPVVAVSMFHAILSIYGLLVFSFYFFFKPYYIVMITNWMFDTMHDIKTPAFYIQSFCVYAFLSVFLAFNVWQAHVSIHFIEHINDEQPRQSHKPTVVVVNKPMY